MFSLLVHHVDARLLAERRVGEDDLEAVARISLERVLQSDGRGLLVSDAMQHQVHGTQPGGVRDDLPAVERFLLEVFLLVPVQLVARHEVVRGEQKAPVPHAGSQIVSSGWGAMTSTTA